MGLLWTVSQHVIVSCRQVLLYLCAHIVSWLALSPSPAHFRRTQAEAIANSIPFLIRVQQPRHSSKLLVRVLIGWSHLAEGDAYLIFIPFLFWVANATLARWLAFAIISGLVAGNVLKDTFQLPRPHDARTPASSQVWVPPSVAASDHSGLRDFGFPSTHVLNAVTNPGVALIFGVRSGALSFTDAPVMTCLLFAAWLVHVCMMVWSRMFLGVHSPTDVKGGLITGLLALVVFNAHMEQFNSWLDTGSNVPLLATLGTAAVLFMCPQPRPRTPTFMENAKLMGLGLGICLASQLQGGGMHTLLPAGSLVAPFHLSTPVMMLARAIVGFPVVIALEVALGEVLKTAVAVVTGINVRVPFKERTAKRVPGSVPPTAGKRTVWWPPQGKDVTSSAFARPDDSRALSQRIGTEAFVRASKYVGVAVTIVHCVPALHAALGL